MEDNRQVESENIIEEKFENEEKVAVKKNKTIEELENEQE